MPIVDGLTATKMIRSQEKLTPSNTRASAGSHSRTSSGIEGIRPPRIPVFAVSASLLEEKRHEYVATGFDGWILKPVDFKRLEFLLKGIVHDRTRAEAVYEKGHWEKGGWFLRKGMDTWETDTTLEGIGVNDVGNDRPEGKEREAEASGEGARVLKHSPIVKDKRPTVAIDS
jgi:CheY-like chemotaxis protein